MHSGSLTEISEEQSENTLFPTYCTRVESDAKFTLERNGHPKKVQSGMQTLYTVASYRY